LSGPEAADGVQIDPPRPPGASKATVRPGEAPRTDHEERIAGGLVEHHRAQLLDQGGRRGERVPHQRAEVLGTERGQDQLGHPRAAAAERLDDLHQGMRRVDLVAAVGADDQHAAQLGPSDQPGQESERGGVGPLEIVEAPRAGARANAPTVEEHAVEGLRLGRVERATGAAAERQPGTTGRPPPFTPTAAWTR
jgi:hypothetical protein